MLCEAPCLLAQLSLGIVRKYGAIWTLHNLKTVHLQHMKQLLCVRTQTHNNFVYDELGRFPLQTNIIISVIRYWLNVIELDNRKCSKIVYNMMLNDQMINPNVNNWASQGVGCSKVCLKVFSQRAKYCMQTWQTELNDSTRASTYMLFF